MQEEGTLDSRAYAERLGVGYSFFRQALAYRRAAQEGREGALKPAMRQPAIRLLASRIAPEERRVGGAPVWRTGEVEAFERDLEARGDRAPARTGRGRRPTLDPLIARLSPGELLSAAAGVLDERETRLLLDRYGDAGDREGEPPRPPKTLDELGAELGMSRQGVGRIQRSAEAKLRAALQRRSGRG